MAILYKGFLFFRTVFCAVLLSFCAGIPAPSFADDPLFTVSNIKVDVKAKNSAIARERAFSNAQQKAFEELSSRMLSDKEEQNFFMPDSNTISTFVQDFEVTKEKLSSVRYIGTYTFRFQGESVRKFFADQGVRYTDVSSRPALVLPFYQLEDETVIWSPENDWMDAWNRIEEQQGLVPIVVPIGDLMDVSALGDDEAFSYSQSKLKKMLKRYGSGEAVLLIAIPDLALSAVESDDEAAAGVLVVQVYRTDRATPEAVQNIIVNAQRRETKAEMFDRATVMVQKALQENWKEKTIVKAGAGNHLLVRVHFTALDEWAETQRALGRVYGVNEVVLKSLSPKEAKVDLIFEGNEGRLRLALAQSDITLSQPRIDFAAIAGGENVGLPLMYELYLNRLRYKIELPPEQPVQSGGITRTPL